MKHNLYLIWVRTEHPQTHLFNKELFTSLCKSHHIVQVLSSQVQLLPTFHLVTEVIAGTVLWYEVIFFPNSKQHKQFSLVKILTQSNRCLALGFSLTMKRASVCYIPKRSVILKQTAPSTGPTIIICSKSKVTWIPLLPSMHTDHRMLGLLENSETPN